MYEGFKIPINRVGGGDYDQKWVQNSILFHFTKIYTLWPTAGQEENVIEHDGEYDYVALIIRTYDADIHVNDLCLFCQIHN